jgi:hypothetical protein
MPSPSAGIAPAVVGTPVMAPNPFLVDAFYDGAQIFDRWGATLLISTENEDDFVRNLATFLVEQRLAFTVRRPQAFVYGAFPYDCHRVMVPLARRLWRAFALPTAVRLQSGLGAASWLFLP